MLNESNQMRFMGGMFQFGGLVISAAQQASDPLVPMTVMCYDVSSDVKFPDSPLFYDLTHGDHLSPWMPHLPCSWARTTLSIKTGMMALL